jgi:pimeloyl-ACP methyl ester carboxylesterase
VRGETERPAERHDRDRRAGHSFHPAPRSWAERAYPGNLIHYNKLDRGGHFAAWEQPSLFSAEMRAAFKTLR